MGQKRHGRRLPAAALTVILGGLAALAGARAAAPATGLQAARSSVLLVTADGTVRPAPYQGWADRLLVPAPPGTVLLGRTCESPLAAGCMEWTLPPRIGLPAPASREVLAHELGHVFDMVVLAPLGWRDRFAAIDGRPWSTPASEERFAQAYAACAQQRSIGSAIASTYHEFRLGPRQFAAACSLIRNAFATWAARDAAAAAAARGAAAPLLDAAAPLP